MSTTSSVRMVECPDTTLRGYVFDNMDHARRWLGQGFVHPDDYRLELVELGPSRRCGCCDGTGLRQRITVTGPTTVQEITGRLL